MMAVRSFDTPTVLLIKDLHIKGFSVMLLAGSPSFSLMLNVPCPEQ